MKQYSMWIVTFVFISMTAVAAEEGYWNQFRGPNGDGISAAKNLPVEFGEGKNVRWKTAIHGHGWSSPVVWGDQVWVTTANKEGTELFAICVDLETGQVIHDIKVFDVAEPQMDNPDLNSYASPTPIIEEGRIYVHFGTYGTACLHTQSGEVLWERRDFECRHFVQPASSPIIDDNSLFLTFDGVDLQYVVALDKRTGETLWRKDREHGRDFGDVMRASGFDPEEAVKDKPGDNNRKSFATPTIIEVDGEKQLISPAAEVTFSYDPETGEENWYAMQEGWSWNVACRPVFAGGLVYVTTGQAAQLVAIRPSGAGDVTETHIVWRVDGREAPTISSPLLLDGLLFVKSDDGSMIFCLDATTGEQVWRGRLPGGGGYWASPVYADEKIYIAGMRGEVYVISAGREFELIAENSFEMSSDPKAGAFVASPAIAGDTIILRSQTHLYCIAE